MQIEDELLLVGSQNAALRNCAPETRAALFQRGTLYSYEVGDKVWGDGEPAGVGFFPLKGKFQLSKTASNGRRQVLCYPEPAGCTSVCLFLMAERSLADIYAIDPSQALIVPAADMTELSAHDMALSREAWKTMGACLSHFVSMVENLSFHKVSERVALALLDATAHNGATVRRTQAELAAEVGTTREVVARCLADFQDLGAIRLGRGRIVVLNRDQLQTAA
jgi:CRP/FNR family transcriptional regulator, anaerobic regulatory protein